MSNACCSATGLVPALASIMIVRAGGKREPTRRSGSSIRDRQQFRPRQHDESGRLDAHRAVALESLQLLVDTLARRAQELREILLRQLQADADLLALGDAIAARQQQGLLGE